MKKNLFILSVFFFVSLIYSFAPAATKDISGPDINIIDNNIIVNLSVMNVEDLEPVIKSGLEKEIAFTVELIRVHNLWPDEFIVSKKIRKTVKYDNLREKYRSKLRDGTNRADKYFNDYNEVKEWLFNVSSVNIANLKELEQGRYYVRTIVESRNRERPLIGFFMYFIPEVEMSMAKESEPFTAGEGR